MSLPRSTNKAEAQNRLLCSAEASNFESERTMRSFMTFFKKTQRGINNGSQDAEEPLESDPQNRTATETESHQAAKVNVKNEWESILQTLSTLEEEILKTEHNKTAMAGDIVKLKKQVALLEACYTEDRKQFLINIDRYSSNLLKCDDQREALESEVSTLKSEKEGLSNELKQVHATLQTIHLNAVAKKEMIEGDMMQEIKRCKEQIEQYALQIKEKNNIIDQLQPGAPALSLMPTKNIVLHEALQLIEAESTHLKEEIAKLRKNTEVHETHCKLLSEEIVQLKEEINCAKGEIADLHKFKCNADEELRSLRAMNTAHCSSLSSNYLLTASEDMCVQIKTLQNENEALQKDLQIQRANNENLNKVLSGTKMLYDVVMCTLQESDTKHTSEVNKLKHQISQLEAEKEKMSKSHTSLCIELHDIVETKKKLEDSIELYHTQAEMYKKDFENERLDRQRMASEIEETKLPKKVKQERNQLRDELKSLKQVCMATDLKISDYEAKILELKQALQVKEEEVMLLTHERIQYKEQVFDLKSQVEQCKVMSKGQVQQCQEMTPDLKLYTIHVLEGLNEKLEKGRGAFGAVYEVKLNGFPCIAKGLHEILLGLGGNYQVAETDKQAIRQKFFNECVLLSKLKHPNIVQFLGIHSTKENEYLVMECMHMDLAKCLETYQDIPVPIKVSILHDVSYGLLHLHSQDPPIIHRDLTATNILLTQDMRAKIADLGVSKIFDLQQLQMTSVQTIAPGTKAYMPPEALIPDPEYDFKLDIFSFGVLSLYTVVQKFPIDYEHRITATVAETQEVQIYRRKHWIEKMGVDHPLHPLVIKCLQDRPELRPTTKMLCGMIEGIIPQQRKEWKNVLELHSQIQTLRCESDKYRKQLGLKSMQ